MHNVAWLKAVSHAASCVTCTKACHLWLYWTPISECTQPCVQGWVHMWGWRLQNWTAVEALSSHQGLLSLSLNACDCSPHTCLTLFSSSVAREYRTLHQETDQANNLHVQSHYCSLVQRGSSYSMIRPSHHVYARHWFVRCRCVPYNQFMSNTLAQAVVQHISVETLDEKNSEHCLGPRACFEGVGLAADLAGAFIIWRFSRFAEVSPEDYRTLMKKSLQKMEVWRLPSTFGSFLGLRTSNVARKFGGTPFSFKQNSNYAKYATQLALKMICCCLSFRHVHETMYNNSSAHQALAVHKLWCSA